jgi:quinol monooxygenase YgiN
MYFGVPQPTPVGGRTPSERKVIVGSIALFGKITAHPGKGDELVAAFAPLFAHAETEPGTEVYVLHRAQDDPDVLMFYELYTDAAALEAHRTSEAMAAAAQQFGPLIAAGEGTVADVVRANPHKADPPRA